MMHILCLLRVVSRVRAGVGFCEVTSTVDMSSPHLDDDRYKWRRRLKVGRRTGAQDSAERVKSE